MPKHGLIHDYDLWANAEQSARKQTTCEVCGASPIVYQWSDYHGEAMCTRCGAPYQLKGGSEEMEREGAYPYPNLRREFVPLAKEYFAANGKFVHYGTSLSRNDGMSDLMSWLRKHHPEALKRKSERDA